MSTASSTRSEPFRSVEAVPGAAQAPAGALPPGTIPGSAPAVDAVWIGGAMEAEWDALVERHPLGTVYHLQGWKRAMEESFAHIHGRFVGLLDRSSRDLVGGLPVYTVRSWLLGRHLVAAPFATYCDPLLRSPSDLREVWSLLEPSLLEMRGGCVHLKARAALSALDEIGFGQTGCYLHHYLPLADGAEKLMKGFSRTNVRQWIQRAERGGLKVDRHRGEAGIGAFYPMFVNTRRRLGLPWAPRRFFEALDRHVGPQRMSFFLAMNGAEPVAGVLTFHYKDTLILESLGESEASRKSGAVQLIFWTAIQQACLEGYRFVSFGRTEKENEGLASHKRCWGCVEETLADYRFPPQSSGSRVSPLMSTGRRWMGTLLQKAPVSIGTALGQILYKHWA